MLLERIPDGNPKASFLRELFRRRSEGFVANTPSDTKYRLSFAPPFVLARVRLTTLDCFEHAT